MSSFCWKKPILVSTHSHPKVAAHFSYAAGSGVCVSTHSHPKVAAKTVAATKSSKAFQHTATRRWLRGFFTRFGKGYLFQHTATRRWLPHAARGLSGVLQVSTHSHPKVAALRQSRCRRRSSSFNTQPPEGGCAGRGKLAGIVGRFNTQPPEGGCLVLTRYFHRLPVSTHSHPKVAAGEQQYYDYAFMVSTHSHPKVAATTPIHFSLIWWFQHTATRRWLQASVRNWGRLIGFNTQPPEGGCSSQIPSNTQSGGFNTQPPEGGCPLPHPPPSR